MPTLAEVAQFVTAAALAYNIWQTWPPFPPAPPSICKGC